MNGTAVLYYNSAMDFFILLGLAFGLSMDAFAVSLTNAALVENLHFRHGFRTALFFGVFQAIMPVIGWAAGITFSTYIQSFDHWVAFILLAFVGGKMVWEGLFSKEEDGCVDDCRHLPTLLLLSIATSIDALAVGLTFAMIKVSIITPALLIGGITFVVCMLAWFIGRRLNSAIGRHASLMGGLVLIGIGIKILVEHLV